MNGIHDLGGMHGFGPIVAEAEETEPVFHADWEKSVLGLFNVLIPLGRFSLDRFRRMIETQDPLDYLRHRYYENWYASMSRLAIDCGFVNNLEFADVMAPPPATGGSSWVPSFEVSTTPRYTAGQRVRAVNRTPEAHTRQPRYVRGRVGVVIGCVGTEPLPELAAENVCVPEHLYCVRFEAAELWGADTTTRDALYIELWESYMEPAP